MANDVRIAWDSFQKGRISRNAYNRSYARFMSMKKRCLESRAFSSKIDGQSIKEEGKFAFTVYVSSDGKRSERYIVSENKQYYFVVSGAVYFSRRGGPGRRLMNDACYEYNSQLRPVPLPVFKNNQNINVCGHYTRNHVYRSQPFVPTGQLQFWIYDTEYSDNSRDLRVDVYSLGTTNNKNSNGSKSIEGTRWERPTTGLPGITSYIAFNADGTWVSGVTYTDNIMRTSGTWKPAGNKIIAKFANQPGRFVGYLNGNVLILEGSVGGRERWNFKAKRKH